MSSHEIAFVEMRSNVNKEREKTKLFSSFFFFSLFSLFLLHWIVYCVCDASIFMYAF